ncbi:hypothetical protein HMPREF6745_0620 [Prevotella sp. oral taxon 472 str. F0295]|nr:hypothetical protein HMPREF6745_0620 [Prevotella sp. oral taxon 472 str. F0295]
MTNEKEVLKKVDNDKCFLSRTRARTYYIRRGNLLYAGMGGYYFRGSDEGNVADRITVGHVLMLWVAPNDSALAWQLFA